MKYLKQVSILFAFTFISEILNRIIPLPIPASIYGLVFLFLCLEFKIIKIDQIKDTADFLLAILPIMFVPSSVGFIKALPLMKKYGIQFLIIGVSTTFLVMIVSGLITQLILRIKKRFNKKSNNESMEAE
ncbi:MAG: CidA/LrgA family protein [Treponema sp.]|nr:CidA/LrgA family protein [Spirochaetia bacterium]MDD7579482.1 CidA/LrgA family protein [Treponema sp.]MCI7440483.1 CidA/LrgA family protein [Spirochaetia bacterium]MDY3759460.1 CidA/LrgA family protein [Treponema sp.]MDY4130183.1 CidA/LrgA family protein [Treponema sp.]